MPGILSHKNRQQLFKHISFFVTPKIKTPVPVQLLKEIILSAGGRGGTIENERRSVKSIKHHQQAFIL